MALIYNGVEVERLIYNGKELEEMKYGSTLVFLKQGTILNQLNFANSNITSLTIEKRR